MIIGISGKKQHGKDTIGKIIQYLMLMNYTGETPDAQEFEHRYVAQKINIENSGWTVKHFADPLKKIVCTLIGCTPEQLEDNAFKEKELGEEWRVWYWTHYKWAMGDNPIGIISGLYISSDEAKESVNRLGEKFDKGFPGAILQSHLLTPRKLLQLIGTECGRQIIHPNIWINALMSGYKAVQYHDGGTFYDKGEFPNWVITDVRFENEVEAIERRGGFMIRVVRDQTQSTDTHPSETALDTHIFEYVITNNGSLEDLVKQVEEILLHKKII